MGKLEESHDNVIGRLSESHEKAMIKIKEYRTLY